MTQYKTIVGYSARSVVWPLCAIVKGLLCLCDLVVYCVIVKTFLQFCSTILCPKLSDQCKWCRVTEEGDRSLHDMQRFADVGYLVYIETLPRTSKTYIGEGASTHESQWFNYPCGYKNINTIKNNNINKSGT